MKKGLDPVPSTSKLPHLHLYYWNHSMLGNCIGTMYNILIFKLSSSNIKFHKIDNDVGSVEPLQIANYIKYRLRHKLCHMIPLSQK